MSNSDYQATYSPEDNKLRLYIGRVPREEYEKLRAEGWTPLYKQREAGGGDFAATWTPARRDTALEYAGEIMDEDMGPEERAADRAERFAGYRDKRTDDAEYEAGRFDSRPTVHGFQSTEKAERSAHRHDRMAARAVDAWGKAEYWQRRTEGVIAHRLHLSSPSVRMGRIKTLEAELRKVESEREQHRKNWEGWGKVLAMDGSKELIPLNDSGYADTSKMNAAQAMAYILASRSDCRIRIEHPDGGEINDNARKIHQCWHGFDAYDFLTKDSYGGGPFRRLTPAEYADLFLKKARKPEDYNASWFNHLTLRLAYENQMLQAQGGRLAHVEMEVGGKLAGHLIMKVCKSPATGRVTSVFIKGEKVQGWQYKTRNVIGADYSLHQIDTERLANGSYTPPTPETLAEIEQLKAQAKAAAPKKDPCPLVNPTDADAERLQAIWNERAKAEYLAGASYHKPEDFKPSTVCRITQAVYSANSKGAHARAVASTIHADANICPRYYGAAEKMQKKHGPAVCKIRTTWGDGNTTNKADRVIILTDKPQKPLPESVWPVVETAKPVETLQLTYA